MEIYSLMVLESRSLKSRCWNGWLLLESLRQNPFDTYLQASGSSGNPWHFLSLIKTPAVEIGPTVIQNDLILGSFPQLYLQILSFSEVPGGQRFRGRHYSTNQCADILSLILFHIYTFHIYMISLLHDSKLILSKIFYL